MSEPRDESQPSEATLIREIIESKNELISLLEKENRELQIENAELRTFLKARG